MKNFDKALKEALEKQQLNYSEEEWTAMEALLETSSKKKGYFSWKIVLTALLLIGVSLALFLTDSNKTQENTVAQSATLNQSSSELKSETKTNQSVSETFNQTAYKSSPLSVSTKNEPNYKRQNTASKWPLLTIGQTNSIPSNDVLVGSGNVAEDGFLKAMRLNGFNPFVKSIFLENPSLFELRKDTTFRYKLKPKKQKSELKLEYALLPFISYNTFNVIKDESVDKKYKENAEIKNQICAGMHIKISKGNISLLTGIQCLRINETADYINRVRQTENDTTLFKIVDLDYSRSRLNNPVYRVEAYIDSSMYSVYQRTYKNENPRLFYLGIPVNIQYAIAIKKFNLYAEAGLLTQVLIQKSGRFLDINKEYNNIVSTGQKRMVYNAQLGLGLNYPLTDKVKLFGTLNYTRNVTSLMSTYDYRLSSNRVSIGIEYLIK